MRALLLLPLLTGCGSLFPANDGTYLMTLKMKSDSCNEDNPSIGQEQDMLVSMYRTAAGTLVLDLGGGLLTGPPPDGQDFEVSYELTSETSYDGCDRAISGSSVTVEGTFSADLGFEGTAKSTDREVYEACPEDEEETCTISYSVTALKLDAATDRHPTGSIAWGYFSGGGGGY